MNKVMSNKLVIALYVLPALLLIVILIYIPLALTGYYGLMNWNGVGNMQFLGLDHYIKVIQDEHFWESTWHSFLLAFFSVLALVLFLALSFVLTSRVKGADLFRKVYIIPLLLSSVAIAQLWSKIYNPANGILNTLLINIGIDNPPVWLGDPNIVLYAIFIPVIWQYGGFYILIYYAALKSVPNSLIDAAIIDGASPFQIAYKVKLPLIKGIIKITIVLAVVGSLKYFDLIWVMTGGGPNGASDVMATYMYREAFTKFNFGYGSAIAFMLLIISLLATVIIRRLTASKEDEEMQY